MAITRHEFEFDSQLEMAVVHLDDAKGNRRFGVIFASSWRRNVLVVNWQYKIVEGTLLADHAWSRESFGAVTLTEQKDYRGTDPIFDFNG